MSLFLGFSTLTVMCLDVVFFVILLAICWAFLELFISFISSEKFMAIRFSVISTFTSVILRFQLHVYFLCLFFFLFSFSLLSEQFFTNVFSVRPYIHFAISAVNCIQYILYKYFLVLKINLYHIFLYYVIFPLTFPYVFL